MITPLGKRLTHMPFASIWVLRRTADRPKFLPYSLSAASTSSAVVLISFIGYLIHEQSLCDPTINFTKDGSIIAFDNTPFSVTIPANVGPSGKYYVLAARVMNTDGSYYTSQVYSDVFELAGANGTWADIQKQGRSLWGDDGMACTGWSCVKDCADAPNMVTTNGTYEKCVNSCPGVSIDPNWSRGGDPTAALVEPSACPSLSSTGATPTGSGDNPTRSSSRTAATASQTGAAASRQNLSILVALMSTPLMTAMLLS